jgi:hypothetical protein
MHIYVVTFLGPKTALDVNPKTTLSELKNMISNILHFPEGNQLYLYETVCGMYNYTIVDKWNLEDNDTLHLVIRSKYIY